MRCDARSRVDYRAMTLETGIMPQCNGSARLKVGGNDVLVGVKVEVGVPRAEAPTEGYPLVSVDCSAGPAPSDHDEGLAEALMLERSIACASTIDWKTLCLAEGCSCWVIYVDILVLHSDGGRLDAMSIATHAALHNTRIPKVEVSVSEKGVELEVSDDPSDFFRLDTNGVPLWITLNKVGGHHLVDPTAEEEACVTSSVAVAVDTRGDNVCGMEKRGGALPASALYECLQTAKTAAAKLQDKMDKYLTQEDPASDLAIFHSKIGFFSR